MEFNGGDLSVSVGFPSGPSVSIHTLLSLMRTSDACARSGIAFNLHSVSGSSLVTFARNRVADAFLKSSSEFLFWIDSDISWEAQDFLRVLMLAKEFDLVCAAYPLKNDSADFVIKHPDLTTFEINPHGLVKVQGAGLGFCCVKRALVEQVAASKPLTYDAVTGLDVADIFRLDSIEVDGRRCSRGEDMAFFADLQDLGYPVWLDPTIKLGHVGEKIYRGDPVASLRLESVYK